MNSGHFTLADHPKSIWLQCRWKYISHRNFHLNTYLVISYHLRMHTIHIYIHTYTDRTTLYIRVFLLTKFPFYTVVCGVQNIHDVDCTIEVGLDNVYVEWLKFRYFIDKISHILQFHKLLKARNIYAISKRMVKISSLSVAEDTVLMVTTMHIFLHNQL